MSNTNGEIVTGKAAVRAGHIDGGHMAMEGAQLVAVGGRQQFKQDRLAKQRLERNGGIR